MLNLKNVTIENFLSFFQHQKPQDCYTDILAVQHTQAFADEKSNYHVAKTVDVYDGSVFMPQRENRSKKEKDVPFRRYEKFET